MGNVGGLPSTILCTDYFIWNAIINFEMSSTTIFFSNSNTDHKWYINVIKEKELFTIYIIYIKS